MKHVVVGGGTGIIGQELEVLLVKEGFKVSILTRNKDKCADSKKYIYWNIDDQFIDDAFNDVDYLINLAGAGIAEKRWTSSRKKIILDSRVKGNELLVAEVKKRNIPLKHFITASAIGFYGDGKEELLTEESGVVTEEFLSDVCVAWEHSGALIKDLKIPYSAVRIGTVLSKEGGALEKLDMSIPYGIANYMGNGKQWMSWIHTTDICGILIHLIKNELEGIFNGVAPEILRAKEFTKILAQSINPKALVLPAPAIALKIALGEMSRVVLNSSKVSSKKIEEAGYQFKYPTLIAAVKDLYQPT